MAEDPRSVLSDPRAPASERFDAESELAKSHIRDLIPRDDIMPVIDFINERLADQEMLVKSAQVIPFPGQPPRGKQGMQSVYVDDMQIFMSQQGRDKPAALGFAQLREMVEQTPILAAIVGTRIRQIGRFCQPSEDGGEGFEIRHMDRDHKLTGPEKDRAKLITRFVQNSGWEFNPRKRKALLRESFAQMMKKSVRDSLAMDACPIEIEWKRDRGQGLDGLYAVDGATVNLCSESGYEGNDKIKALQEVDGRVATAYTYDDLIYEVRNPRTDVRLAGYGFGETEQLIRVVTGFLNALNMNINGFDQNAIPKGILQLVGDYDKGDLAAFKRSWNAQVKGINGRWAVPAFVSRDPASKVEFHEIGVKFDEMAFAKWMTLMTSMSCALFGMDPAEINFESFATNRSSLSGSDTEEKLTSSRDTGLHPDMAFYEAMLTDFVVAEFDTDLCFRWVGLREEDAKWQQEMAKLSWTVDELRASDGKDPWPDKDSIVGSAPINSSLIPVWQAEQQAKNPPPGGDFGASAPPAQSGPDYGDPDAPEPGAAQAPPRPGAESPGRGLGDPAAAGRAGAADTEGAKPEFGGGSSGGSFGKAFQLTPIFTIGTE